MTLLQGMNAISVTLGVSIVHLIFVIWQIRNVLAQDTGTDRMREIAAAIQEGASAFLNREYTFLAGFVAVVAVILGIAINWQTAASFVLGAFPYWGGWLFGHVHRRGHSNVRAEPPRPVSA